MNPIDFNCSHQMPDLTNCRAGKGDPCREMKPNEYHEERIFAAAYANGEPAQNYEGMLKAINKAIDERLF